jgi:hypothetical protein
MVAHERSGGVTMAATYALLCCGAALLLWGFVLLKVLNMYDDQGHAYYQVFPAAFAVMALVPPALIAIGARTAIGLLQLRPWARLLATAWAAVCIAICLALIALRPFETFFIPQHFVHENILARQIVSISFVVMLLPLSVWWLFYFRAPSVKLQFQEHANSATEDPAPAGVEAKRG